MGNFLGYWLAPSLPAFVNGSLNVPKDVMEARSAVLRGMGRSPDESLAALLDRYGVDVFLGTRLPTAATSIRSLTHTTTHLDWAPDWLLVFRSVDSAVYLKNNERNQHNFERIASYYESRSVPFDPVRGFDPASVIRLSPRWAVEHGLRPVGYDALLESARSMNPAARAFGRNALASYYVTVGLYEKAIAQDERALRSAPNALSAARRRVWCLLHLRRFDEARTLADALEAVAAPEDSISRRIVDAARRAPELAESDRVSLVTTLPLLTRAEGARVLSRVVEPRARPSPWRRPRPIQ
jgi:tetratricopeptide (TPR) repeat protein